MARIDTLTESNGPDRFNIHPGCASHHAGVRTGIKDYCCCCDPCAYVRKDESASQPDNRLCCRCLPRWIVAKFTGGDGDACCRNTVTPMRATVDDVGGVEVIKYSGNIAGHAVAVYLSNSPIDEYTSDYEDATCRWTISIPTLGIDYEVPIDHVTVTCLGVPSVEITGVTAFEGCSGTISLANYSTVKVPFHVRPELDDPAIDTLTVPFPEGFESYDCESLPRFICVTKKHNRVTHLRSPRVSWEIEWWRDFIWDEYHTPYFIPADDEWIIGKWDYQPPVTTAFEQHLWLIYKDGEYFIQPDFESPIGTDGTGETYARMPLSSCGCTFKILNARPVSDPSPPAIPGESVPDDLLGIDLRAGRCGCWDYICGHRRCVPRYLCGTLWVDQTLYLGLLFTFDMATKCWGSSGGLDTDGNPMPFSVNICMRKDEDGECELYVDYPGYTLNGISIGDTETVFGGGFSGPSDYGDDYFQLSINTSFDGDCTRFLSCQTATPCAGGCGSHPELLYLRIHGWSEATDIPPPPTTGECTTEIILYYGEVVTAGETGILVACEYNGYALVDSYYMDPLTMIAGRATMLIRARLSLGSLTIYRSLASDPTNILQTESAVLSTETCEPYYGYKLTPSSLKSCFFGDSEIIFHRWEVEITE